MSLLFDTVTNFYGLVAQNQIEKLLAIFSGEPAINTPLQGEVSGATAFAKFVNEQQAWLQKYQGRVEVFAIIETPARIVAEYILYLSKDGTQTDLPVAVVYEREGDKIAAIRLYHSTWPLNNEHLVRSPLLNPQLGLEEPPIVEQYMTALAVGEIVGVMALFEETGYVREPSGTKYKHVAATGRQEFYDVAFANGGVSLKHCSATFDGARFAVEYICDEWGKAKLVPQAGMAVYEIGASGLLAAVRIYDDVTPPFE
jgi:hypothetical protein